MTAADRWRADLEAWAIPQELLDAVDESPYGWPVEMFRRRNETARTADEPETTRIVAELLGDDGTLLDVGAGTGRASIPLAVAGHRVVGVERSPAMADGLRQELADLDADYTVIEAGWPIDSPDIGMFDVVMCANVVYDVQDIVPFLTAMQAHARRAVVVELTETHPWSSLAPYYRALHGLERPDGPTVDDLVDVVEEMTGTPPTVERWQRGGGMWFESWDEIERLWARRLVLPSDRREELRSLLEPDVVEVDGRLSVGDPTRRMATVWWRP